MIRKDIEKYMRIALELSKKVRGETFPNPLVGAVVVKNGKIVGHGFHKKAGGAHAEILALKEAGIKAQGAILFCTFEPCAHFGRTGPCVDAIIKSGIVQVYAGIVDPNPLTRGKGVAILRKNGLKVEVGFLEEEIQELNQSFVKAMTKHLPFVTIKIAQSIDGRIATRTGESKWITGEKMRRFSHDLRRFYDAIMVGINTVLKDDPALESSAGFVSRRLTKVIVDSNLRIPVTARLLKTSQPVVVAAIRKDRLKEKQLLKNGARVIYTRSQNGKVDLRNLFEELHKMEIRNVLVEGGATLNGAVLDAGLADRALIFIAPKIIGGKKALSSIGGLGVESLGKAIKLKNISMKRISEDFLVEGDLLYVHGNR